MPPDQSVDEGPKPLITSDAGAVLAVAARAEAHCRPMSSLFESAAKVSPNAAQLFHVDSNLAVGGADGVLVFVWRNQTTLEGTAICREYVERTCANHGREFCVLNIVEARATLPDAKPRQAIAEMLRRGEDWIQASALIFEATGFFAATIRSVVTGITLVAKQNFPHRVFDRVDAAARFIEQQHRSAPNRRWTAYQIAEIVADLRRQVG
jgi:hypothetical protein